MNDIDRESRVNRAIQRMSTLILLVFFVFIILFVSTALSGIISYILIHLGIFPPLTESRFPVILLFVVIVSMFIGTVLAILGGDFVLRPLRILTDATKRVAAGDFSVRVHVKSSSEITRLAESFNEMAEDLSSIETLRDDFVSNISHEFKTPVVSIRGFARRLKKNTLTEEQRDEYLDIIISETERLTQLSSNVLLLSKLQSTDKVVEASEYSLDEQMRRSILLLEPQLEKKNLELDVRLDPVRINANDEMLQHMWINILSNAIKFSPEGGEIGVTLETRSDGKEAVVSICDKGIGMDDETKSHLFDKFYQKDPSRATEGNGLGLSLVKRIADLYGGTITVESTVGEGSSFTVTLPL